MLRLLRTLTLTLLAAGIAGVLGTPDAGAATASRTIATFPICSLCVQNASDLSRYQYVTLNAWQHDVAARLKAQNPALKVLVYKDMSSTRSHGCRNGTDDALLPAGVGYCFADRSHPDWFTRDQTGSRIEWAGFPGHWQMDIGNAGYQDRWFESVAAELQAKGWDGVSIDNANVDPSGYFGSRTAAEYPTNAAYAAATRSFLASVGPRLKARGFLVLPNIQANPVLAPASLWADWIQFTSGGIREYWMKWSTGTGGHYGGQGWADMQAVFDTVQDAGKIFLTSAYGPATDVRTMRWARATFLVGWNGGASALSFDTASSTDPWSAEWTLDIGTPVGARYAVGNARLRNYTGGTAVVNVSSSSSQTVTLDRRHFLSDGTATTSVTLAPLTGLVLRSDAPPSAAPAPGTASPAPSTGSSTSPAPGTTAPSQPAPKPKVRPRNRRLSSLVVGAYSRLRSSGRVRPAAAARGLPARLGQLAARLAD